MYHCDNDAVDRQVLALEFEGGVTGTFTMTAFENGRHIEMYGTRGVLKGGRNLPPPFRDAPGVFSRMKGELCATPCRPKTAATSCTGAATPVW